MSPLRRRTTAARPWRRLTTPRPMRLPGLLKMRRNTRPAARLAPHPTRPDRVTALKSTSSACVRTPGASLASCPSPCPSLPVKRARASGRPKCGRRSPAPSTHAHPRHKFRSRRGARGAGPRPGARATASLVGRRFASHRYRCTVCALHRLPRGQYPCGRLSA